MIRPADRLGNVLTGRAQAHVLRGEILDCLQDERQVVIDLSGVDAMSPSFADEVFAKLADEIAAGRVQFEGISPAIQSLARFVTLGRTKDRS